MEQPADQGAARRPAWIAFRPPHGRQAPDRPLVRIHPNGQLSLTKVAHALAGAPVGYILLYDATERLIGFKPSAGDDRATYRPRTVGRSSSFHIHSRTFWSQFGIALPDRIETYEARLLDGVLVIGPLGVAALEHDHAGR